MTTDADTRLDRAVQEAIDAAPPLTDEQREAVVRLLSSGGDE